MNPFDFHLPTLVCFGNGRVRDMNDRIGQDNQRIMIVTDKNLAAVSEIMNAVKKLLADREITWFDGVEENPSLATLEKGRALAREHNVQLVVGLGGGSPMDAAKGIAVLATNDGNMRDYMKGEPLGTDPLPVVCIPTTSGTGSEVTPYAVFTDPEAGVKGGYAHPSLFPRLSIVDPELTYTMPQGVIVNTGLDALTHAVEAYLSTEASPLSDIFALESIQSVLAHLPGAARKDHQAMSRMAYASMLAGVAITHGGTILLHIMGYPLTVFHGIAHGLANAILLPEFMRFMREKSTVKSKVAVIDGMFEKAGGVEAFVKGLGVSTSLSSYGIQESEIDTFVAKVIVKGDVKITPASVTEKTIADIFRAAMG